MHIKPGLQVMVKRAWGSLRSQQGICRSNQAGHDPLLHTGPRIPPDNMR